MAGVGKSTISAALAEALGYRFIDLDEFIINKVHNTPQGVIDAQGEEALLDLE